MVGDLSPWLAGSVAFGTFVWGVYTYFRKSKWASAARRCNYLDKMLEKFLLNEVRDEILECDASNGTDEIFKKIGSQDAAIQRKARRTLEELLFWIEQLLYLKKLGFVEELEFGFFEYDIRAILSDENVQGYLEGESEGTDSDPSRARFKLLATYINEHQLRCETDKAKDNTDTMVESQRTDVPSCSGTVQTSNKIVEEDFDSPTMIIRINRLYREGMNDDQVYETVRGSWRVRPENADKYKVVLAVAFGTVKGAYLADHWEPSTKPGGQGRYAFVRRRDAAEEKRLARFVGKDVSGLFPKGAANPIRYFDVASEGRNYER